MKLYDVWMFFSEAKVNIFSEKPRLSGTSTAASTSTPEHHPCLKDASKSNGNLETEVLCKEITHDVLTEEVFRVLIEKHGNIFFTDPEKIQNFESKNSN